MWGFQDVSLLTRSTRGVYKIFLLSLSWNSRADEQHYSRKLWPLREEFTPGAHNVIRQPLVQREKILLPTLHIKLGLALTELKNWLAGPGSVEDFRKLRSFYSHRVPKYPVVGH